MENKEKTAKQKKAENVECEERCPYHGTLSVRGRNFKGTVKKIVGRRAVIEWERMIYYPKFERYARLKSTLHAHVPKCLLPQMKIGDYVEIGECRPLSKIIHFVLTKKIKDAEEKQ